MRPKLEGVWAPTPTPLTKEGDVDEKQIVKLVDFLVEGGIDGLVPLGTTGEFAMFAREERKAVARASIEGANGRIPIFVGVSDPSPENVLRFTADAKDLGADGVIATPPYYYTTSGTGIYEHYKWIAEKGDMPLMIYNIPAWTNSFVPPETVERLADEGLIVGMKYTEYNLYNLLRFIQVAGEKISIFTGSDAMAYTTLEFGGSGGVMGSANIAPKIASRIFDAHRGGKSEEARDAQKRLVPVIQGMMVGKFPAGLKEAMDLVGMPVGRVKSPLMPVSDSERSQIKECLRTAGLLD